MSMNFLAILIAAIVPLIVGFIWYNPKVLGNAWMKASGMTPEMAKGANMAVVFGVTLLFSLMIAFIMQSVVIHQYSVFGLIMNEPGAMENTGAAYEDAMAYVRKYGQYYLSFKHGAFHGTLTGIFLALPILGINSLYERKGAKYIFINAGYWIITLALMGGVICKWGVTIN